MQNELFVGLTALAFVQFSTLVFRLNNSNHIQQNCAIRGGLKRKHRINHLGQPSLKNPWFFHPATRDTFLPPPKPTPRPLPSPSHSYLIEDALAATATQKSQPIAAQKRWPSGPPFGQRTAPQCASDRRSGVRILDGVIGAGRAEMVGREIRGRVRRVRWWW